MTGTTWAALRALLVDRYGDFRARLTRQFGSEELASETLHETWLHLHRHDEAGAVQRPAAFLMRIAANIARDRQRAERRRLRRSEVNAALEIADPAPGPAREAEARRDLSLAERAIAELPERTRAILVASRLEGQTHQAIASRLGISRRTVLYELRRAIAHLDARLEEGGFSGCAPEPPESS
ncbi:sigma-70 family RNA polymerase sigma factor [Bradyrhizobium sp. U87765 SZCCT0131]|nr:sigma-70 family RNA polymerase sigma factor [Bradyrhizobium sp. U87765 SZCCT0131]MBR1264421.1 sigma-70 family RNA polymerase sigma factor [Bradyrhizobium sp. U87765 SZCCT0134]MBR1304672.1 sigma-70 family RNA polymerase sigma factor [Bradyrhizobium sp. U87765 SZCCT0110]MBR1322471.1 sigma-70 family RNA polymerase sigma factor [Bradyrhizobium sp. U87765 SZCCT0109]MBR1346601.1 sigma-70 family RNA polymerase sigma factor [Bradyrhizobium sp. U87765 SZCCT0048]